MSKIQVLSPEVAERIAAGEVVDRPASVVKELVENALDAGATEISVVLEDGGRTLIEVLDNGQGMDASDLRLCLLRHATSKIRAFEDLMALQTLGFRGEALASVAAVSELSIVSRTQGARDTHELLAQDFPSKQAAISKITFGHFLGTEHGTCVRVKNLFSTVPARLKFLKSPRSETTAIREILDRIAVANPGIGFRLVSSAGGINGEERRLIDYRPDTQAARVEAVLGEGQNFGVACHIENGLQIFWLKGASSPSLRRLIQVVNHRIVKDKLVQQAVMQAFKQSLLPGQFPVLALFLDVPGSEIDVNAHPAKSEVRFADSAKIFSMVNRALESLIGGGSQGSYVGPLVPQSAYSHSVYNDSALSGYSPAPSSIPQEQVSLPFRPTQHPILEALAQGRVLGTLLNTYIVIDLGDRLGLIDQHAAAERVRYESLKRQFHEGAIKGQLLLVPEVVSVASEKIAIFQNRLSELGKLGFEAEVFGEESLVFRAVPSAWGQANLRARLANLLDRMAEPPPKTDGAGGAFAEYEAGGLAAEDEHLFERLASEACHGSIRAGDRVSPLGVQALLEAMLRCEHPWNCPHGRPTFVEIPQARIEEWFQRKPQS